MPAHRRALCSGMIIIPAKLIHYITRFMPRDSPNIPKDDSRDDSGQRPKVKGDSG